MFGKNAERALFLFKSAKAKGFGLSTPKPLLLNPNPSRLGRNDLDV
jgi:hypothetical protein